MVVFNKSLQTNSNQTILKKRFEKKPRHPTLHFGDIGLFLTRQIRFEYGYMLYIRRFIKRIIKKRRKKIFKIRHRRKRVWFCIRPNYILSKKSKNSRMGKGKGGFKRWCSLLPKGFPLVEFYGISVRLIFKYKYRLQKRLQLPITLYTRTIRYTKRSSWHLFGSSKTADSKKRNFRIF